MTRPAGDVMDSKVSGTVSDGNTVIAGSDDAAGDPNHIAGAYVHAVCVGTVFRCCYVEVRQ